MSAHSLALPKPRPPAPNDPLRCGCTLADSGRLDALGAPAMQLSRLRGLPYERYMAALAELGSVMHEVLQIHAAYQANHDRFDIRHNPATPHRAANWFVMTTEAHPTPGRVLSIHFDLEAARAACEILRTHQHVWVEAGSYRARFHVCDVCSVRKDAVGGQIDSVHFK